MQSMLAILALYAAMMASFSSAVSGQEPLGVMKCVVVRHTGHVRSAWDGWWSKGRRGGDGVSVRYS